MSKAEIYFEVDADKRYKAWRRHRKTVRLKLIGNRFEYMKDFDARVYELGLKKLQEGYNG